MELQAIDVHSHRVSIDTDCPLVDPVRGLRDSAAVDSGSEVEPGIPSCSARHQFDLS